MTTKSNKSKEKGAKEVKRTQSSSPNSVIAKTADGSVQITFTIPWKDVSESRNKAASEIGKGLDIPGFRKGKAPIEKVIEKVPQNDLLQKTLTGILPELLAKSISEHKIKPAIYPRFEVLKAVDEEDWQVKAVTCEIPEFGLGDYKDKIKGSLKVKEIWTPDSAKSPTLQSHGDKTAPAGKPDKEKREIPQAEKEQKILKMLLDEIKVEVPSLLLNEEVNAKLSQLLAKIEKLGLDLDAYLKSIGKTAETLRGEYASQAKNTIGLELILSKIAREEKIVISDQQIDQAIEAAAQADPKSKDKLNTPEQRNYIRSVLSRRTVLDRLISIA